jgi:hypothetical protein
LFAHVAVANLPAAAIPKGICFALLVMAAASHAMLRFVT